LFILRVVGLFALLFLLGLGVAYFVTKDRKYLRIAWRTLQALLLLFVAFGLLYVFERVLLMV
jgi:hypothetical protein